MATQKTHNPIRVGNPPIDGNSRTYLTQDVDVGATSLPVASISGFPGTTEIDFYVLIGVYGDEKAEIKLVDASATNGKDFTIEATISSHEASDPITVIDYNSIQYYGLASSSSTTYNHLITLDIDATKQFTEYVYTGAVYPYYSTAYFQSNDDSISGYSEIISSETFTRRSAERIIRSGARKALTQIDENQNSRLTMEIALEILQDGLDEIGARKKRWPFWFTTSTGVTIASQDYLTAPSDLTQLVRIKIDGLQLDLFTQYDYNRYTEGVNSTGQPSNFAIFGEKYKLFPTPERAWDVEYTYYKVPDVISDMSTEIAIPLVPVLIYYCGSQFAYIRGNEKKGDSLYKMYVKLLEEQVEEYSGPDQDGVAEYIERTSVLDDETFAGLAV